MSTPSVSKRVDSADVALLHARIAELETALATQTRLTEDLRRSEARLRILADASLRFAAEHPNLATLLATIAHSIAETIGDLCVVRLFSPDGATVLPGYAAHRDPVAQSLVAPFAQHTYPLQTVAIGHVVRSGEPLLRPTIPAEEFRTSVLMENTPYLDQFGVSSLLIVALQVRGSAIGAISLFRNADGLAYTSDDLALLQDLANHAALAVKAAHTYADEQAAQQATGEAIALLDTLFAAAPVGLAFLDTNLRFVRINASLAETNGPSPAAHLGHTLSEILPTIAPTMEPIYRQVLAIGKAICDLEVHGTTPANPSLPRDWIASCYPVPRSDGTLAGVGVVVSEITERIQAHAALQRQATTLQEQAALLEHAHVLICDLDGRIIAWNQGAAALYGWTAGEAVGQFARDLLQTHFPVSFAALQQQLLTHGDWEGELVHIRRNGTKLVVASHQVLFHDLQGRPLRILEVDNDITALKEVEQSLRERDAQLHLAYDAALMGTWRRDFASDLVQIDARAQIHFGVHASMVPTAMILDRVHPADRTLWLQAVAMTMEPTYDKPFAIEYRVIHPDGSLHWLAIYVRVSFRGEGAARRPVQSNGTTQDITARKQEEAALRTSEAELRDSEARFRMLAEQAQDLIYRYRLSPEPGFEYVSPSATAITGYTPEDHYADPLLGVKLVHPADRHLIERLARDPAAAEAPLTLRWQRKDGREIWTEQVNRVITDATGQPVAIEGIARDVTARKQAEEHVRIALTAEQIARQAAEAASERTTRLQAVTAALANALTREAVVEVIMAYSMAATGNDATVISLLDPTNQHLEVVGWTGHKAKDLAAFQTIPLAAPLPPAYAARTHQPVWLTSRADADARFPGAGIIMAQFGHHAYAVLPLMTAARVQGIVSFSYQSPNAFAPEDQAFLLNLAQQCAQALERARLYTEVQATHVRLQSLSQHLLTSQEQERRHIARELHDEIGQVLGALKINLHMLHTQSDALNTHARVEESLAMLNRLIEQVRSLSLDLRPAVLDDLGLSAALAWYTERLAQRTGLTVNFQDELATCAVPPAIATVCFRITQEALTNVVRHAQAHAVTVNLAQHDGILSLLIRDDGVGFDVVTKRAAAAVGASLGLLSMIERAELAGGWTDIASTLGEGTEVWAWFPLATTQALKPSAREGV